MHTAPRGSVISLLLYVMKKPLLSQRKKGDLNDTNDKNVGNRLTAQNVLLSGAEPEIDSRDSHPIGN